MQILEIAIKVEGGIGKGGIGNLAKKLEIGQTAVSNWRVRGVPRAWEKLLELKYGRHRARIEKAEQEKAKKAQPAT